MVKRQHPHNTNISIQNNFYRQMRLLFWKYQCQKKYSLALLTLHCSAFVQKAHFVKYLVGMRKPHENETKQNCRPGAMSQIAFFFFFFSPSLIFPYHLSLKSSICRHHQIKTCQSSSIFLLSSVETVLKRAEVDS